MADRRISEGINTSMNNIDQTSETATDFRRVIDSAQQDFPGTRYYPDWNKWYGIYKVIPDVHAVIDNLATWTVGRGYKVSKKGFLNKRGKATKEQLERITGAGIDSFNGIIANQVRTAVISGDSFAEIVRNKRGELTNLKPISPGSMVVESNRFGIISRYVQVTMYHDDKNRIDRRKEINFKPERILHLAWNRLGDEPHGRSIMEPMMDVIDMKNEAQKDMRIVFHRYVKPMIVTKIDSDDATEIEAFRTKLDNSVKNMENLIVPQGTVEMERISIPQYSTLDPIPWLRLLQKYFTIASGVPEIILGGGKDTTEASAKILYLAFQQTVEYIQLWVEEQLRMQVRVDVEFEFPENIGPELQMDIQKERNINNFGDTGGGGGVNAVSRKSGRPNG